LNVLIGTEEPKYLPFKRAPTEVDVIIHSVSLTVIPNKTRYLDEEVRKTFCVTYRFERARAKFLKPNEQDRKDKKATSIIFSIPETKINNFRSPKTPCISKYKKSTVM